MVGDSGTTNSRNNLELTIAVPLSGGVGSSSVSPYEDRQQSVRNLDINQLPAAEELPLASVEDGEEEEEEAGNLHRPKKLRLTKEQTRLLEECFRHNHTLNPRQKEALASKLKLKIRQVEVWFQNRRARSKLKQTEMECEYLKRCFGSLSEENRRLQCEVEELRAMRVALPRSAALSPQYSRLQPMPASSSLVMCPRCERVTPNVNVGGLLHGRPSS